MITKSDAALRTVSCMINPAHPQAPYGAVQLDTGYLIMEGLVQETVMTGTSESPTSTSEEGDYLDLDLADAHLDSYDEISGCDMFSLQICCFDSSTCMGPSGLLSATRDGKDFSRIGMFTFEPPQQYDVEELGDFDALLELSEARLGVQRSAFQGIVPRMIKIM